MKKQLIFLGFVMALVAYSLPNQAQHSLRGKWRFALDPHNQGLEQQWQKRTLTDPIVLPGSLQEQGYGNDIGVETPWTGWVVDKSWYNEPAYEQYRKPGSVKVPFWLNPDKHYVGVAWYQKEIDVPNQWAGLPVELELERTHWETTLFLDGVQMGKHESLSTPFRHLFSALTPGKHTITLRIDNRLNIAVGPNAHSVSDHTQSNWNGVVGNLSLNVQPILRIDNLQIYPNITDKSITAVVTLDGKSGVERASLLLQIERKDGTPVGKPYPIQIASPKDMTQRVVLPLGKEALLWSEHQPNLYQVRARVKSGRHSDTQIHPFGLREFKANGTRFEVNGQPVFLRGTLECCIFPLTGYPAMDHAYWTKIYSQCKAHGLNHVRFHSWCPPKAAFEVADSMGVYLQVECAGWTTVGDGGVSDRWFRDESDRILKEYGNHPSFCMMAYGNEPDGGNQAKYLSELIAYWKSKDLRRVYTSSGGWPYVENADYSNPMDPRIQRWAEGLGSIINAQQPRTDFDFASTIRKNMPTVSHEVGQWCAYPNFKEIEKYTGVLKAKNFEIFRQTLAEHHMADLAQAFLYASGRLQTLCYKADIEGALRTPGFAGFQLLDLHDFPGQGSALVGVLDPFWDEKGYVSPEEYRTFCSPTVPLVRFPKMVWLNNEVLNVPIEIAHFGAKAIDDAAVIWQVSNRSGDVLAQGAFERDLPLGNCIEVGRIHCSLSQVEEPSQLTVSVKVEGTDGCNRWNIWVYPHQPATTPAMPYLATRLDSLAMAQLEGGANVLLLLEPGTIRPNKGGNIAVGFSSIFWNTAWTNKQPPHTLGIYCHPEHPALAAFPTEQYSDYQWWDVVSACTAMVLDDFPAAYRPIVHLVDDWFTNRKLGILLEGKVGNGKLIVCSVDLQKNMDQRPAARQFRQSILEYMASERFDPTFALDPALIRSLYQND